MRLAMIVLLCACGSAEPPTAKPVPPKPGPAPAAELDARFVETIRAFAPAYKGWGRVDDQVNVAPTDCKAPPNPGNGGQVRMSAAPDSPHDQKLYYLWSNDRALYRNTGPIKPGFAIVKESFRAVPADPNDKLPMFDEPIAHLEVGGARLKTGEPAGLFVMTKVSASPSGSENDGTDAGWVYGTVAVDGTVTSAGRVSSCMGCHEASATRERLFGLKK